MSAILDADVSELSTSVGMWLQNVAAESVTLA